MLTKNTNQFFQIQRFQQCYPSTLVHTSTVASKCPTHHWKHTSRKKHLIMPWVTCKSRSLFLTVGFHLLKNSTEPSYSTLIAQQLCKDPYTEFVNILVSQTAGEEDFVKDLTAYFFTSAAASINRRWVAKSKATVRVAYKKNTYC